jgi:hypothetical protein
MEKNAMLPAQVGPPHMLLLMPLAIICAIVFHLIADRGIW